jgi:hypothetical protein
MSKPIQRNSRVPMFPIEEGVWGLDHAGTGENPG